MYCQRCGKEIPEDSEFCPFCGELVALKSKTDNNNAVNMGFVEDKKQDDTTKSSGKKRKLIWIAFASFGIALAVGISLFLINQSKMKQYEKNLEAMMRYADKSGVETIIGNYICYIDDGEHLINLYHQINLPKTETDVDCIGYIMCGKWDDWMQIDFYRDNTITVVYKNDYGELSLVRESPLKFQKFTSYNYVMESSPASRTILLEGIKGFSNQVFDLLDSVSSQFSSYGLGFR